MMKNLSILHFLEKHWKKSVFILMIIHSLLSIWLGLKLPWGGDEWYTLKDTGILGLPNKLLIYLVKLLVGPLNSHNYMFYRFTGLFWILILYVIFILTKSILEKNNLLSLVFIFLISITFNPFIFFQEQLFRYYGFYLFVSFLIFFFYYFTKESYMKYRIYYYIILILSPFIHFVTFIQISCFIFIKEFLLVSVKVRLFIISIFTILLITISFYWQIFLTYLIKLAYKDAEITGGELRGIGIRTIIKPLQSIFNYFFGYDTLVTENYIVLILFILLIIFIVLGLLNFLTINFNNKKIEFLSLSIIPFILLFFVVEPLTLPGSTQFEGKHTLFVIPWIIFILSYQRTVNFKFVSVLTIFICSLTGIFYSFSFPKENWNTVIKISKKSSVHLTDGNANQTFKFYSNFKKNYNSISTIWDTTIVKYKVRNNKDLSLTLLDYKSYQLITKEQMWNTGSGSEERFLRVNFVLSELKKSGFKAIESYSHYPLMTYRFIKTNHIQPIPWFYGFAYADLHLPVAIEKDTVLGWFPYQSGDTIPLGKPFYYMIESTGAEKITFNLIKSDNTSLRLESKTEEDKFRSHFCMAIKGYDKKVKEWHKRPLLSSSLAYPGSYTPGTGYIYKFNPKTGEKALVVKGKDVKVWFGVER